MMISPTGQNNKNIRDSAFTLLELIVVMLIIATTLAMAAPSLRGFFATRQTNDAARHILAMTRYARSQAIAEARTYCLEIDTYENTCKLYIASGGGKQKIKNDIARQYELPVTLTMKVDDIASNAGVAEIYFTSEGTCTPATIVINGKQDNSYRVYCKSATELFVMTKERDS